MGIQGFRVFQLKGNLDYENVRRTFRRVRKDGKNHQSYRVREQAAWHYHGNMGCRGFAVDFQLTGSTARSPIGERARERNMTMRKTIVSALAILASATTANAATIKVKTDGAVSVVALSGSIGFGDAAKFVARTKR